MALVPAQCTKCGASLTVEPKEDAAICPYCNTPFIVQKAITNFTQSNIINADVVNIYGGQADFVIRGGKLERYNGSSIDITIPNGVISIGADAFLGCDNIRKIVMPISLKEVETTSFRHEIIGLQRKSAIAQCTRLESVEFLEGTTVIPSNTFKRCTTNFSVILPDSISQIGASAFEKCFELTSIRLPNSIRTIQRDAFSNCRKLSGIDLPASLEVIEENAFEQCYNLKDIVIPANVKLIKAGAFRSCTNLRNVKFNDKLEEIGECAFADCQSLETVCIPKGVKKIGRIAFHACVSLTSVLIKANDITIDQEAFHEYLKREAKCLYCGGSISIFKKCKQCGKQY